MATYLWCLTGRRGIISDLPFIIVPPCKHFAITGAGQAVEGSTRYVHHLAVSQSTENTLWGALVGVVSVAKSEIVSFPPV